jgi:hypothetical protein
MERWTMFMHCLAIIIFSSCYHACNSFNGSCFANPVTLRYGDFFWAQLVIPHAVFLLIKLAPAWYKTQRIGLFSAGILIYFSLILWGDGLMIQLVIAAISLLVLIVYWITYVAIYGLFPEYQWFPLMTGIGALGIASTLYIFQTQVPSLRWALHSDWHRLAALGLACIIWCRKRVPWSHYAALDKPIIKEDDDSDFVLVSGDANIWDVFKKFK